MHPHERGGHGSGRQSKATRGTPPFQWTSDDGHLPGMEPTRPPTRKQKAPSWPARGSAESTARTVAFWQPRTTRSLGHEDAREIVENLTGFFQLLQEWERADRLASDQPSRTEIN
jgi:hypothetical protein